MARPPTQRGSGRPPIVQVAGRGGDFLTDTACGGAGGQKRFARVEIVNHPRQEVQHVVVEVANTREELDAGREQDRQVPVVEAVQA
jgi:hypothetical protein